MKDKMKQNMTQNMTEDIKENMTQNMTEDIKENMTGTKYLEAMEKEASDGPGTKGIHGVKEKSFGRGIELADAVK